jgi:hypothetical protein
MGKVCGLSPWLKDRGSTGPWWTGDRGHGGGSSEDGRNGAPVRGTSPRLRKKSEGMAVILIGCRRGRRRGGGDQATVVKKRQRKRSVWAALGHGGKRRGAGRGAMEDDGALPLCRGRAGGDGR